MDDYPGESWAGAPVFLITKGFFLLVCAELPGGQKNDIRGDEPCDQCPISHVISACAVT